MEFPCKLVLCFLDGCVFEDSIEDSIQEDNQKVKRDNKESETDSDGSDQELNEALVVKSVKLIGKRNIEAKEKVERENMIEAAPTSFYRHIASLKKKEDYKPKRNIDQYF